MKIILFWIFRNNPVFVAYFRQNIHKFTDIWFYVRNNTGTYSKIKLHEPFRREKSYIWIEGVNGKVRQASVNYFFPYPQGEVV